jgi:hypothetical protein
MLNGSALKRQFHLFHLLFRFLRGFEVFLRRRKRLPVRRHFEEAAKATFSPQEYARSVALKEWAPKN